MNNEHIGDSERERETTDMDFEMDDLEYVTGRRWHTHTKMEVMRRPR